LSVQPNLQEKIDLLDGCEAVNRRTTDATDKARLGECERKLLVGIIDDLEKSVETLEP